MIRNIWKLFERIEIIGRTKSFTEKMSETIDQIKNQAVNQKLTKNDQRYKSRYNGRCKKRKWVDYRSENSNEEKRATFNKEDRVKKRKCCMLIGYSGVNYFGMQRNPEMKTIEEDLLVAMLKNKWITEEGYKIPQQIHFQRAARTDKGVSAARQCVSVKLPEEINIEDLNKDLPSVIRIFSVKRTTKGFNSKDQCCARTYTYTLPTIAFADHSDYTINDAIDKLEAFRVTSEKLIKVNETLKVFEGTKNFHNFTAKKEFIDASAKRFIISIECTTPFIIKNIEFVTIKIKGQSFMLHQIRKMIGLSLAVIRCLTTIDTIKLAFNKDHIDIPTAPGLGLVLDQVHYDWYNERYGDDGIHEKLVWDKEETEIQHFINTFIFPNIYETEIQEKSMINWLDTLTRHSYTVNNDRNVTNNDEIDNEEDDDDADKSTNDIQDNQLAGEELNNDDQQNNKMMEKN